MPKGRQSPSSSSSPTPSASSRVSRLAGMLMLIPALVSASPRAGQTDSVASAQPSQASFGPLMSGFVDQPSSPYHFGAKDPVYDPPPSTPSPPGSTAERLSRIRQQARTVPDVPGAESAWREHISSLRSREGVVQESLSEAMGYISNGISAEISGRPTPGRASNSSSVRANLAACKERLREYDEVNAIRGPLPAPPKVVHPLLAIVKPDKKPRLCLDLSRNYNDLVRKRKFRLLALETAVRWSREGCYYGKLDLSSCFLSFPLAPDTARDMGFELDGKHYQFTSMPFGLSSAPRIASLLLDVVSSRLHEAGIRHVRYLDDFLFIGADEESCLSSMEFAARVIHDFGLVVNPSKVEGPAQRLDFLGLVLDSVSQTTGITDSRLSEITGLLEEFLGSRKTSRRRLLSLLGKLSFVGSVFPAARPFTRYLIDAAKHRSSAKSRAGRARRTQQGAREDARFWLDHLSAWNGSQRWRATQLPFVHGSDASARGGFSLVMESAPSHRAHLLPDWLQPGHAVAGVWGRELWVQQSSSKQIAYGELFPVVAAAVAAGPAMQDGHIVFACENAGVCALINRRRVRDSKSRHRLLPLLRRLAAASVEYNFAFTAIHRPGARNVLADVLSRPRLHKFQLDLARLYPAILEEHRRPSVVKDKAPTTHSYAYGSFFFDDPVTRVAAATPLLTPSRVSLCSSASLVSLMRKGQPSEAALGI